MTRHPAFRVVLDDLGGHHEHVLVHERDTEIGGIDRSRAVFSCGTTLMLERRAPEFVQIEGKTDGCRHSCHNGLRMLRLIWRSGFAGELAPRLLRSELHHSRMTSGHRGEEPDADGDVARVDAARRAAVVEAPRRVWRAASPWQPERHRSARRVAKAACSNTSPTNATSTRSSPTSAVSGCGPTWKTASANSTRADIFRIPHRPARRLGRLLRRPSTGAFASCRASFEVDTDARISVRSVIHRHYLEVLRPLVREAQARDLGRRRHRRAVVVAAHDLPHLALAPYVRAWIPFLGSTTPHPSSLPWPCAGWWPCWRPLSPAG
ncbi:tetR family transcriptional regulator domain protein [Mycobacterium xenopi 3993]|nr:tetR family transcriptional regulator domain protein [Mycobacterium xenopi 3993]